jgi:hypothetical protein
VGITKVSVECNACHDFFEDYGELAQHIAGQKKGHRKGKIWAAKFLLKVRKLDARKDLKERVPLSEEDKENRRELRVELSGVTKMTNTQCPKCKSPHAEALEIEYVKSPLIWATSRGTPLILCARCRG